jgi:hypothetical protein
MYKTARIPARQALLGGGGLAALLALAHLTGDALNSMLSARRAMPRPRYGIGAEFTAKSCEVHKPSLVLTRCLILDASPLFQKSPRP